MIEFFHGARLRLATALLCMKNFYLAFKLWVSKTVLQSFNVLICHWSLFSSYLHCHKLSNQPKARQNLESKQVQFSVSCLLKAKDASVTLCHGELSERQFSLSNVSQQTAPVCVADLRQLK